MITEAKIPQIAHDFRVVSNLIAHMLNGCVRIYTVEGLYLVQVASLRSFEAKLLN